MHLRLLYSLCFFHAVIQDRCWIVCCIEFWWHMIFMLALVMCTSVMVSKHMKVALCCCNGCSSSRCTGSVNATKHFSEHVYVVNVLLTCLHWCYFGGATAVWPSGLEHSIWVRAFFAAVAWLLQPVLDGTCYQITVQRCHSCSSQTLHMRRCFKKTWTKNETHQNAKPKPYLLTCWNPRFTQADLRISARQLKMWATQSYCRLGLWGL